MKKSVYSLVLMDDIVEAIDQLAYSLNTSRSNLINQILAEKVALVTPEQRLQRLFDELTSQLRPHQHFQIQTQAAEHMYSIKSALRYKYNPTIRYSFYIGQQTGRLTGELRIISRTQSEVLQAYLKHFFDLWSAIENDKEPAIWQQEEGVKWLRVLRLDAFAGSSTYPYLADSLSNYIQTLDKGLKLYFSHIEQGHIEGRIIKTHHDQYYEQMKLHV